MDCEIYTQIIKTNILRTNADIIGVLRACIVSGKQKNMK